MKLTTTFFTLSLTLTAIATPLGDRAVFRRHSGVPANNARRYILQSRMDAPPACIAKASASSTDLPVPSSSIVADPTATDVPTNTTDDGSVANSDATDASNTDTTGNSTDTSNTGTTGNSTDTSNTGTTGNSTDTSNTDTSGDVSADNSTATDASNSTDTNTPRRRRLAANFAQLDLPDLAIEWQTLCLASGGNIFIEHSPCVELAGIGGINALLADADPCAQQDIADAMISFAKSPGIVNRDALIAFALKYRRHPRNAINILGVVPSTLYCQRAPVNPELIGVSNGQINGVNPGLFGSPNLPIVPFGANGTCPFGTTPDVSSCTCVPDSINGTDVNTPTDGGVDGSSITDPSATGSVDNSTVADPSATSSVDNSTVADPSATASAGDATATDASTSGDDSTPSDSAATDAPAPTDSASLDASVTDTAASSTTFDGVPPAPTVSQPSDISGNVNDPNGRRK